MTVGELVRELSQFDPETEVMANSIDGLWEPVLFVEVGSAYREVHLSTEG